MKYFAIIDDVQCGPFLLEELADNGVGPDTYVWCKGMDDWKQAREVADICRFFRNRIFDKMHSKSLSVEKSQDCEVESQEIQSVGGVSRFPQLADFDELNRLHRNVDIPPRTWFLEALILTILCFPLTGFVAIYFSVKSSRAWRENKKEESHDLAQKSKMWCGFTFFFGLIFLAFVSKLFV